MPVEFDPAWEYWVPEDEEIAEIFDYENRQDFSLLDLQEKRIEKKFGNIGFRFGRGESAIKSMAFKLKIPRSEGYRTVNIPLKRCVGCQKLFKPVHKNRTACSYKCAALGRWNALRKSRVVLRAGKVKTLEEINCKICGVSFKPKYDGNAFCSRSCFGKHEGQQKKGKPAKGGKGKDHEAIVAMRKSGFGTTEIAGKCGTTPKNVRRILEHHGLPLDKPGRKKGCSDKRLKMLKQLFKKDDRVKIIVEDESRVRPEFRVNGKEAVVEKVETWGCHLTGTGVGTGKYRALWSEMVLLDSREGRVDLAREMGYTGDPCGRCQAMTVKRNGNCAVCDSCGETSGVGKEGLS